MGSDGHLQLSAAAGTAVRSLPQRAALMALGAALGAAVLFSPVKLCLVAVALHVPCPGCGMTRATLALLRGDFAHALALHPLSPVIAPSVLGVLTLQSIAYLRTGAPFGTGRVPRALEIVGAILLMLLLGVWLARFFGCFGGPVSLS